MSFLVAMVASFYGQPLLFAQSTQPTAASQDPLAARQQIVRERLVQLEDRMFRLREKLSATEPQQARRLEKALQESGELLIRRHMEEASRLLEQSDLAGAVEHQAAAEKALQRVLVLLTETGTDSQDRQKEIDRVQALREQVDKLLERQENLRGQTNPAERIAERLAVVAARLQQLIDRQARQIDAARTAANKNGKPQTADLAEAQAGIRKDTDALMDELAPTPASQPAGQAASQPANDPLLHLAEDARHALQDASDHMQAAQSELGENQPVAAGARQAKAMESLQQALKSIQEKQKALESLRPSEATRRQQELQKEADKLADNMEGKSTGSQPAGDASQPVGKQQDSTETAGAQSVRQSGEHMKNAGGKLQQNQPAQATQDQDQAIEKLEQAQAELQETLEQLRREQQEEALASLEQRFRAMLLTQKQINTDTDGLEARKDMWTRADSLSLATLSQKQKQLGGEAGSALNVLNEEGTTVVFPEILVQVRDDMLAVARRLGEQQTGTVTHSMQADVVQALEELVAAVEQRRKDGPPPSGGGAGGGGGGGKNDEQPLLPGSAELKLLRSCQLRLNRATKELSVAADQPAADVAEQARRLSGRQEELTEMARKMNERAEKQ